MSNGHTVSKAQAACRPAGLAHVVLRTARFSEMVDWWAEFLGANIAYRNENACFLQYDHEHHRLAIFNMPDLGDKEGRHCGVDHLAFSYDNLNDLFAAYEARKATGVKPWWSTNHGMTMSIYYMDPDRNMIENQVDTFATAEEAHKYMQQDADFLINPIGVDFVPEEIMARLAAGESQESVMKRHSMGPRVPSSVPFPL